MAMLHSNRVESEREALLEKLRDNMQLLNRLSTEVRAQEKRTTRRVQEEQRERALLQSLQMEEERRAHLQAKVQNEEKIARELERQKLSDLRLRKLRQLIRINSPELRDLERKLFEAEVVKTQKTQIAQKAAIDPDKELDKLYAESVKKENEEYDKRELEKKKKLLEEKNKLHQQLLAQFKEHEEKRHEAYIEYMKEKLMIDNIVQKILEEDLEEFKKKEEGKKRLYESMKIHQEVSLKAKEEEKKRGAQEDKVRESFVRAVREREELQWKLNQEKVGRREDVKGKVAEMIEKESTKKEEEDMLRVELAIEEKEERERQLEQEKIEQQLRKRLEGIRLRDESMQEKKKRDESERKEMEQYRLQVLTQLAEEDKLEQLSDQRRRRKMMEHGRKVRELMEQRVREREAARRAEEEELRHLRDLERCRQQLVDEARREMLDDKARKLLGYLPKNVFRSQQDLQQMGSDFTDFYKKMYDSDEDDLPIPEDEQMP